MDKDTALPGVRLDGPEPLIEPGVTRLPANGSLRRNGRGSPRLAFGSAQRKILILFGTRPEIIKLAPVIHHLEDYSSGFRPLKVASGQHTDLLYPFARALNVAIDVDLRIMKPGQTLNYVCSQVIGLLDPVLFQEKPDLVLVQGDTTTALAGALAAFNQRIPVGHIEAGLRSGDVSNPYPEEMNRRVISLLATYHFAATARNHQTLRAEGVPPQNIFITGNPVVDSLKAMVQRSDWSPTIQGVLQATQGRKRLVLTTHRRESFGEALAGNLRVLRSFVERREDVALIFPVHPNPAVREPAAALLGGHERIHLMAPLDYVDFISLLKHAWLIVSDSGGIQEEAPTLGKPLLVLRETTERPEALEAGVARLVGGRPERLQVMLDEVYQDPNWIEEVGKIDNPFGRGDSGARIVDHLRQLLGVSVSRRLAA
jgi:UDP-N-acetylglucosamine 2-epimerase (non-hydrolysing)